MSKIEIWDDTYNKGVPIKVTPEFVKHYGKEQIYVYECIHCDSRYWSDTGLKEYWDMPCEFCDASCRIIARITAPEERQQKLTEVLS